MGNPKLSTFLIALVWISFFAVIISTFLANMTSNYNTVYDGQNLSIYNKLGELNASVSEYQNETKSFKENPSFTDVIGQYFSNGYKVMLMAGKSFNIVGTMTNEAVGSSGMNTVAGYSLKTAILLTILIFIIIGVIISAIIKMRI